ncbi:hypothetical protein RP20_CCG018334 [Aedes albopictus]|nr:hypothetical protein RP20_CCG018334 [Aedes albopictus]
MSTVNKQERTRNSGRSHGTPDYRKRVCAAASKHGQRNDGGKNEGEAGTWNAGQDYAVAAAIDCET